MVATALVSVAFMGMSFLNGLAFAVYEYLETPYSIVSQ